MNPKRLLKESQIYLIFERQLFVEWTIENLGRFNSYEANYGWMFVKFGNKV